MRFWNCLCLNSGISWIHRATSGIFSTHRTWRSHCRRRFHFDDPLQFGSQILSVLQSMKILDVKAAVYKKWKELETTPAWQLEKVKSKKEVILETERVKKKVHFATLLDVCHLKKGGVRTTFTEVQRQNRAPWRHCKWRLWSPCSLYWARLLCVPDDCGKRGCYCKITRLRRTSSWCSICLHSSKIGGSSQIAQSSQVRVSRRKDTSSTTQVAEILGRHWRTIFKWTPIAGWLWERQFGNVLLGLGRERVPKLGMYVRSLETKVTSVRKFGWLQNGWTEAEYGSPCGRKWWKNVDLEEPTSFLDHVQLGSTQRECKPTEIIIEEHKDVWITCFYWSNWKITRVEETSRKDDCMVPRHGRTCSKMRWAILWVGK